MTIVIKIRKKNVMNGCYQKSIISALREIIQEAKNLLPHHTYSLQDGAFVKTAEDGCIARNSISIYLTMSILLKLHQFMGKGFSESTMIPPSYRKKWRTKPSDGSLCLLVSCHLHFIWDQKGIQVRLYLVKQQLWHKTRKKLEELPEYYF